MATRPSKKTPERGKKDRSTAQDAMSMRQTTNRTTPSEDERRRMVAEAAYYRALRRGFSAGGEVEDWLAAEREIARQLQMH